MKLRLIPFSLLAALAFASCRSTSTSPTPPSSTGWSKGNFGTSYAIEGICFPTTKIGFACGFNGTLLRTVDGGTTWTPLVSGTTENLYRVAFDNANGYGIVAGNDGTVLRSSDGGLTWLPIVVPFVYVNGILENVRDVAISGKNVVIVGGTQDNDGFVLTSSDEGLTWPLRKQTGGTIYSIAMMANQTNYRVVGISGQIYSTPDLGHTWKDESQVVTANDFEAVAMATDAVGFVASYYGTIYHTVGSGTGGVYWSPETSGVTSQLRTIRALSPNEAWIAGDGGVILHTLDGGATWSRADNSAFSGQWNEIVSRDANTLAFIGDNGTLYWYGY